LFLDGSHKLNLVKLDIELWLPKVREEGIIACHDTWAKLGSNLATAMMLLMSSQIKNPKLIDTITYCQKVEKNSSLDRIRNAAFLLYRTLFGWIGAIKLGQKGTVIK